jgi:hypothetical protein
MICLDDQIKKNKIDVSLAGTEERRSAYRV